MGYHYIISDTHHGPEKIINYFKNVAEKDGPAQVSGTGDFSNYLANPNGPKKLDHEFLKAYRKGDKEGMKKVEADFTKTCYENTAKSGKKWVEIAPYIAGGKINSIWGNTDPMYDGRFKKFVGKSMNDALGGKKSPINFISSPTVKQYDNTAFLYVPHAFSLLSKYKDKKYKEIKDALKDDPMYQSLADQVKNSKNINIIMHESPAPEKWYKGKKVQDRLPDPLRAHYDLIVENVANAAKNSKITAFHGHLHENTKQYNYQTNTANLNKVRVQLLNIDDVVKYDTHRGEYKVEVAKAPPASGLDEKVEQEEHTNDGHGHNEEPHKGGHEKTHAHHANVYSIKSGEKVDNHKEGGEHAKKAA